MGTKQWLEVWGFNVAAAPSKASVSADNEVAALLRRLTAAATGRPTRRRTDLIALPA
ncbi:MAG: hypothetical protein ABI809_08890 [Caldimonas sp.]